MIGGMRYILSLLVLLANPTLSLAAGLVPCGGKDEIACDKDICFAGKLIDNVTDWLVGIASIILVLIIIYGGLRIVTAVGNVSAVQSARKLITTGIIGYILMLTAWMLIDTGLKFFTLDPAWGVWNPFSCT